MAVDYEKEKSNINTNKTNDLAALDSTYGTLNETTGKYEGGMIGGAGKFFEDQIDAVEDWEKKQKKLQNQKTDFAIEKIEQQKAQAEKDYKKEQSGAYVDWQKQSNQYGANAEAMAAQGMAKTGYAESSQVAMYNQYQTRITAAREAYNLAVLNYDNAIKDAQIQNSSILAEIAYESLQKQLELSLQGFQYKNQLITEKTNAARAVKQDYWQQYQTILSQQESARQFNATMAENKRQFNILHPQNTGGSGGKLKLTKTATKGNTANKTKYGQIKKDLESGKAANMIGATDYINKLISSGATKDKVANEIALALSRGALTKEEAATLRSRYTPRGLQY